MKQKSAKERLWWAQFNALQMGSGWDDTDIEKPQIMIEDVYGDSHPGSVHLHQLAKQAEIGVFEKGGFPAHYHTTDVCDGCAQGHDGMNVVLASREAAAGGPIAFIEEGDLIRYDIEARSLNLVGVSGKEVTPDEAAAILAERSKKGIIPRPARKGFYKRYTEHALSAMQGAGLD